MSPVPDHDASTPSDISESYHPAPRRAAVDVDERDDGTLVLRCPYPPRPIGGHMIDVFVDRARRFGDRTLIAELVGGEWQHLTYAQALDGCRRVAQWLLDHDASVDRPLAILSPSSRRHFLMAWGAQMARVPYCPVSVSYSTVPGAFPKLDWVLGRVAPAFVFAEDLSVHRGGLESIDPASDTGRILADATIVSADGDDGNVPIDTLLAVEPTRAVDDSIATIDGDTVTRYMFTSGSTGMPKGVQQTQAMHQSFLGAMTAFDDGPPGADEVRVLDWMPWSHTGAGVMRLNSVVHDAGSVYLDDGRPVPGQFEATVINLADVRPTTYSGSPLGWSMVIDALEADDELAATFFADVDSYAFGSAAMPSALATRIQRLATRHRGDAVLLSTSLLSTEVSAGLLRWWPTDDHDVLGLPAPGAVIKLVPLGGDRWEIRPGGDGITPGYLGDPAATEAAFDDEGFFRMGDAVRFADPDDPVRGLCFAGRVSEDFKLLSGTWVQAGTLRSQVVAATSPYVRDAVVCGLNERDVTLLVWPNLEQCRALSGEEHPARSDAVRTAVASGLAEHNRANPASSTRIARFLLLDEPPDPGRYEITDKGYVNQRAVLEHRASQVEHLYDEPLGPGVIVVADTTTS